MQHSNPAYHHDSADAAPPEPQDGSVPIVLDPTFLDTRPASKENGSKLSPDYDPYENRDVPHPLTNYDAMFHIMKASCGTGILAMPNAFHNAGYAIGLVGTAVVGFICTYCVHILIQAEYALCKRRRIPSLAYHEIAKEAFLDGPRFMRPFANAARYSVHIFLCIYQLGTLSVYTLFIANNVKAVADQYGEELDVRLYMVFLFIPLVLINWIRNLKYLAPFSTFAVATTILAFAVTLYYIFRDLPSVTTREPVGQVANFPLFFGTVLFALEAIGVIVPLENEMRKPRQFLGATGVLNRAMVPIVILYIFLGFFGYIAYGSGAAGSITLNLPSTEKLAQAVKIMIAIAIFGTHPLQCYVAVDILWNNYLAKKFLKNPHFLAIELTFRTVLVIFAGLLAVAIPNLGPFISLVGALSLSIAGIFLPACIQLNTFWFEYTGGRFLWLVSKNTLICVFALVGLVTGTYTSLLDIIAG